MTEITTGATAMAVDLMAATQTEAEGAPHASNVVSTFRGVIMIYFYILVAIVVLVAIVTVQRVPKEVENEPNKIHARARKVKEERARTRRRKLREETSVPEEAGGWVFPGEIGASSDGGFDGGSSDGGGGSSTHF